MNTKKRWKKNPCKWRCEVSFSNGIQKYSNKCEEEDLVNKVIPEEAAKVEVVTIQYLSGGIGKVQGNQIIVLNSQI